MFSPSIVSALVATLLVPGAFGAKLFVSHFSGQVYTLNYEPHDNGKGTLEIESTTTGCGNMPSWLTLHAESNTLYCFDESSGGGVVSSFNTSGGSLELSGKATTAGNDVHGWFFEGPYGKDFLSTAEYGSSSITTYELPLTAQSQVHQRKVFSMSGPGPNVSRQDAPHPHATFTDPTGKFLLVPDLGADLIRIFRIKFMGELEACPSAKTAPGDGPRHGAWWSPKAGSKEGQVLYIVNELANSVTGWEVSYPDFGCLTLKKTQALSTFEAGEPPSSSSPVKAAEVHVKGNFLYASIRNDQSFGEGLDSIATYNISSTGVLD